MSKQIIYSCLFIKSLQGLIVCCLLLSFNVYAGDRFNAQKRYLYVQPGQSVFSIVKVLYPNQKEQWPTIIKKVVKVNPHAFAGGDAIKIKVGERIQLPAVSSFVKSVAANKPVVLNKIHAVGQVIKRRGKTFAISRKKIKRPLDIGSEVFVGDRVFTGVRGFIRLNMIDDAKIDLRCNSEMLIEDYQLLRGGNRSVIYLIKGSVKKITGTIGKMTEDLYEMRTPLATVGVRGTEYAIRVLQQYGCDGSLDVNSKGLFVKVNRGEIDLQSKQEKVVLNKDEAVHLEDDNSQLEKIEVSTGVFDEVVIEEKKDHFFGSIVWLLLLSPLVMMMRKLVHNE